MYDVIVIGAGATGCAIARELSRFSLKLAVLEREEDVCCGTSQANSAIVHAGYDALPGTQKAKMNVLGNEKMEQLSKDLDFPFKRNGSLVLCFPKKGYPRWKRFIKEESPMECPPSGSFEEKRCFIWNQICPAMWWLSWTRPPAGSYVLLK